MFKKILNPRLLRSALFALCVGSGSAQAAPAIRIVSTVPSAGMVTVTLNADAAATGHLTLLQGSGASCGSAAQIAVGQDSTNAPAYRQGALALAAGANASYTVRNLAQSTSYTLCATNGAGIDTATFSTAPMATYSVADWEAVGGAGISAGSAHSQSLSFAPDGTPYVAYSDGSHSDKTTVMRYNGAGWVNVGDAGFSAGLAEHQSLSFAPDGTPYVAYMDNSKSNKATVMRFVGGSWQVVGSLGFSAGAAQFLSLSFAPDGTPYVAYRDNGNSTVMRYNGADWVDVGSAGGLSVGLASYQSLSFAPDGTLYVAYQDSSKGSQTTVMRFVDSSWQAVGSPGFSAAGAGYQSLSFAPDGTPYVAYMDNSKSNKATVMRFVDSSWQVVGIPGFSAGAASYQSLAFAPDGTPYVAYRDGSKGNQTTVMRYNGTDWVEVGSPGGLSVGEANDQSLAFAPDGTPYVAYRDEGSGGKTTVMRLAPVVPSAPTAVTAVAGDGQATVTFTAPASNGSAITGYSVTSSPAGGTGSCAAPPATTCTVTGLNNGTAYTFTVTATNGVGTGSGSAQSPAVTPVPALRIVSTVPSAGMVTVTLNADAAATGHLTLLQGIASCGSAAQIAAGQDSTNAAAYRQGALALAAGANASYTVRNLAHSASYTLCATDSAGSAVASKNFTTLAMTTYTNPGWQAVGGAGFSAGATYQSLTFAPDGTPYVAYSDGAGQKNTVMHFGGVAWTAVGGAELSGERAFAQSVSFAPDGTLYVAFADVSNRCNGGTTACNAKATVMRYNAAASPTAWELVGSAGFSFGQVSGLSLTFAPDGTPYVIYMSNTNPGGGSNKTAVKRFVDGAWESVDDAPLLVDTAQYQSLAFAPDGTLYIAYRQSVLPGETKVLRLNTAVSPNAWVPVSTTGLSKGHYQTLSFAPDGRLYMAYMDASSSKSTVKRWDGSTWVNVGGAGFSAGGAHYPSLSFAPDGTPYVAYMDADNGNKTTVMRFVSGNWQNVGSAGFSAGVAQYQSLSFAPDGTPYVAYQDEGNGQRTMVMRLVGLPGAPTAVSAVAGNGQATVSFTTSTVAGSSAITGYTVTAAPDGATCSATPPATSCVVTGLTNGTAYTFTVTATSSAGTGAPSLASDAVTPAGIPVNGLCGSANGVAALAAPSANLCSPGTASGVASAATAFTWDCAGSNGGTTAQCSAPRQYQVTASAGANGSITPAGVQTVAYNATPSFTITPAALYRIDSVSGCSGTLVGSTYTTGAVAANCTVSASFALIAHAITATAQPSAGGSATCTPSSVSEGGSATCTAIANTGYVFQKWTGACADKAAACNLSNIIAAQTSVALFAQQTGLVVPEGAQQGKDLGLELQPSVANWVLQSASTATVASIDSALPSGVTLPHGLVTLKLDTGVQGSSATVVLTYPQALPAGTKYYKFGKTAANTTNHWYEFNGAVISGHTITLTLTDGGAGDNDLLANSVIDDPGGPAVVTALPPPPPPPPPPSPVELQISTSGAGTVQRSVAGSIIGTQGSSTTVEYPHSQAVTLTAKPQAGARFNGWSGACFGMLTCQLTLRSNQAVQATFSSAAGGTSLCRSNSFSANEERVIGAYLAYYGRPADVAGLTYWTVYLGGKGGNIDAIIDAFGHSQEFQQRFGQLTDKELIANLYRQIYGRVPEGNGAAFYEQQLASGLYSLASIAVNILDGSAGSDRLVLERRQAVARHFVTRMEELGANAPVMEDGDALARLLSGVGGAAESAKAGCALVDSLLDKPAH